MKKITSYLRPYLFLVIISPVMMICEVLADLCLPKLMTYIVDYGISEGGLSLLQADGGFPLWVLETLFGDSFGQMHVILTFGILMLLVTLFGGFVGVGAAFTSSRAAQGFGHDLRCDAYKKVMSLSIEQTDKFTTGSLVTRMTNDISIIVELVESLTRHFVRAPVFVIGGTILLLSLNLDFGIILLCSLPVLALTIGIVLFKAIPMYAEVQKRLDRVNSVVQENVSGARVVKAYVCEEYEGNRFNDANGALVDVNLKVLKLMAFITPVLHIVQNGAVIALIAIGGNAIRNGIGDMTVGTIMAGISYVTQVVSSIMMVTMMFQTVSRAMASGKRVSEILNTEPVILGGTGKEKQNGDVAIAFEQVSFRYPGTVGRPVLSNVNLEIKRGETLAVIGATGCGKTTLVSLIPRFYDTVEGKVTVNGRNVKDYNTEELRKKIGYVMQKSELFSDTVANNILWGKPEATPDDVRMSARIAQADSFISSLPDGYSTLIAEKGASLSGGQKQRISIARALCRHPEILILDDATSALDLSTEARLQKALREELKDTTVILIAQRIASVKKADRIAVLENGTVTDCAPHDVLMERCATYRDIYESQMKKEEENDHGATEHQ